MPGGGGKVPKFIEEWVKSILKENPKLKEEDAYAIAIGRAQDLGYLRKGSLKLTKKGRQYSQKYYREG